MTISCSKSETKFKSQQKEEAPPKTEPKIESNTPEIQTPRLEPPRQELPPVGVVHSKIQPPPPPQFQQIDLEFDQRIRREGGHSGHIQISLIWNNGNDLDLHVTTPRRHMIYFREPMHDGGFLDVDMNADEIVLDPVENVFWSQPLHGRYFVQVNHYNNHGFPDPTPFTVRIKMGDQVEYYNRTISHTNGRNLMVIATFAYD